MSFRRGALILGTQAVLRVSMIYWGSLKASHIQAASRISTFSMFSCLLLGIFRDFTPWSGLRDLPHFPRIRFRSLISKIRPTGFNMTGLR